MGMCFIHKISNHHHTNTKRKIRLDKKRNRRTTLIIAHGQTELPEGPRPDGISGKMLNFTSTITIDQT